MLPVERHLEAALAKHQTLMPAGLEVARRQTHTLWLVQEAGHLLRDGLDLEARRQQLDGPAVEERLQDTVVEAVERQRRVMEMAARHQDGEVLVWVEEKHRTPTQTLVRLVDERLRLNTLREDHQG